jgi:hypothetical protein
MAAYMLKYVSHSQMIHVTYFWSFILATVKSYWLEKLYCAILYKLGIYLCTQLHFQWNLCYTDIHNNLQLWEHN